MPTFNPEEHLPLTPAVFYILLVLADGERHGYSIMKEVEAHSDGQIKMGPGTLYGSVKRMLAAQFIEEAESRTDEDDERRRYYRLTDFGRRVAAAEARRLSTLVKLAQEKQLLGETFAWKGV